MSRILKKNDENSLITSYHSTVYRLPVVQGPTDSSLKLVIGRVSWESDRKIARCGIIWSFYLRNCILGTNNRIIICNTNGQCNVYWRLFIQTHFRMERTGATWEASDSLTIIWIGIDTNMWNDSSGWLDHSTLLSISRSGDGHVALISLRLRLGFQRNFLSRMKIQTENFFRSLRLISTRLLFSSTQSHSDSESTSLCSYSLMLHAYIEEATRVKVYPS